MVLLEIDRLSFLVPARPVLGAVALADAVVELSSRVFGHLTDAIRTREKLVLAGRAARGLMTAHGLSPEQAVDLIVGGLLGQPESTGIVTNRLQAES